MPNANFAYSFWLFSKTKKIIEMNKELGFFWLKPFFAYTPDIENNNYCVIKN